MELNQTDLAQALRAAAAHVPPTSIDLDRLIDAEQRRQRWLHTGTAVGGVAAATLAIIAVATALLGAPGGPRDDAPAAPPLLPSVTTSASAATSWPDRPCPTVADTGPPRAYQTSAPSPRAVRETCGQATARLEAAMQSALRTHAGDVVVTDMVGSAQGVRFWRANDNNLTSSAGLSAVTPAGRGRVGVEVKPRTFRPDEAELRRSYGCEPGSPSNVTCVYRPEADGTVVSGVVMSGTKAQPGRRQYQISIFRPDDTLVFIIASNSYTEQERDPLTESKIGAPEPPLTLEQIVAIGRHPDLTLYP